MSLIIEKVGPLNLRVSDERKLYRLPRHACEACLSLVASHQLASSYDDILVAGAATEEWRWVG